MTLSTPSTAHRTGLGRTLWDKRITQSDLAASLDPPVTKSTVSRWVSGERELPPGRIPEIARLLGVKQQRITRSA